MKLIRNAHLKNALLTMLGGTLAIALAAALYAPVLCLPALAAGLFCTAVFLVSAKKRYAAIEQMSFDIDRILHGTEQALISQCEEGELSILRSQVQKMTLRLSEQAQALREDKIRMSDALADISHQLRTPLTAMNITVAMLSEPELKPQQRAELLRELKRSLARIDWLIEALLKMSRLDAGAVQFRSDPVAVRELVSRASAALLIPMELRQQELSVEVGDEQFCGDLMWSAEALGNILKNCMEHTPAGGRVSVTARQTPIFTEICVSDTGPGFAKSELPHLFERFYRGANASTESVGIGLSLSRMIITAQNGTIAAANGANGGALFTLRFFNANEPSV